MPAMKRVLLGLIGSNIGRSLTPAMQEAAARSVGLDLRYHLIDTEALGLGAEDLPRILAGVRVTGFAGVNVTHPWKVAAVPLLDEASDSARAIGAVNTVVVRDGRLIGHNTDSTGFATAWRRVFGTRSPGAVALIGAGGAGRAIAHALAGLAATELRIVDVDAARADALAESVRSHWPAVHAARTADVRDAVQGAEGIVYATPIGMHGHPGTPLPGGGFPRGAAWAADAVYTPLETEFIAAARAAGAAVMTGQELAIGQAVNAFSLFFDRPGPDAVMRAAFHEHLNAVDG
jgi:shikimate dehydrogenase